MADVNGNKIMNIQVNGLVNIDDKLSAQSENPVQNDTISLNLGNALKGSKSGQFITIDDIAPVEHSLNVKLTSDVITDFSEEKVIYGKNLFDADTVLPSLYNEEYPTRVYKKQEDGTFYNSNISRLDGSVWFENTLGYTGKFVISITIKTVNDNPTKVGLRLVVVYTDGTKKNLNTYGNSEFTTYTLITDGTKTVDYISQDSNYGFSSYLKDIVIAHNCEALADTNGIVEGVISFHPNVVLLTNNSDVTINCEYNRDVNIAFSELQNAIISLGGNI